MGAKIASFLATLILSIPLAAIGLMAIFGIPQLVPANGESGSVKDNVIRNVQDAFNWNERSGKREGEPRDQFESAPAFGSDSVQDHHSQGHSHWDDHAPPSQYASNSSSSPAIESAPYQQFRSESQNSRNSSPVNEDAPRHWSEIPSMQASPVNQSAVRDSDPFRSSRNETPVGRTAAGDRSFHESVPQLTWREASVRLSEMGVKDYHLERGAAPGTFLFVCVFSPGDAPHIVHRFEAEADDPLEAVNQVLQQVDKWMRSRYASSNFPSKPQSLSPSSGAALR